MLSLRLAFPSDKDICLAIDKQFDIRGPKPEVLDYLIEQEQVWLAISGTTVVGFIA